jgi:hypothetical protein
MLAMLITDSGIYVPSNIHTGISITQYYQRLQ